MQDKKFYDLIIENNRDFDRVLHFLSIMSSEAENARTRTLASKSISDLTTVMEVCKLLSEQSKKQSEF